MRPFRKFHQFALFAAGLSAAAADVDYEVLASGTSIHTDVRHYVRVRSQESIEAGEPPSHPGVTWLEPRTGDVNISSKKIVINYVSFYFIALSPGKLELPPIPVKIGGAPVLVRPPLIDVKPNPNPPEDTRLVTLWNGKRNPPSSLRVGQSVDLEILQLVARPDLIEDTRSLYFATPGMVLSGVRWHQFEINPVAYSRDTRFFPFGRSNFSQTTTTLRGRIFTARRNKARFTALRPGRADGFVHSTMGYSGRRRSPVIDVSIPILPLPDPPGSSFTDTGLIGDWSFSGALSPSQPVPGEPFTLVIDIKGRGQASRLKELDFSRPGFHSAGIATVTKKDSTFDRWSARFTQTLLPSGNAAVFPAIRLGHFNTSNDSWSIDEVTERIILPGFNLPSERLAPASALGPAIQRPVLLNLHPSIFLVFGLLPLLPVGIGLVLRVVESRDPGRAARRKNLRTLIRDLRSAGKDDAAALVSDVALPLLREELDLPAGASAMEIATRMEDRDDVLAGMLRQHAAAEFSSADRPDPADWVKHLTKLSLSIIAALILIPDGLSAATLEEANTSYTSGNYGEAIDQYRELIAGHPDHPALYLNLAKAQLASDQVASARATCHTALLLQPRNEDARDLMNRILVELGQPPLPGQALFAFRPDQLIVIAAVAWIAAFVWLAFRKLRPVPRWPALVLLGTAPLLIGLAFWRNSTTYAPGQFMVLANELPRQPTPGKPSFEFPPLEHGDIVRSTGANESQSHILVKTPAASFWLPSEHVQQIW